MSEFYYNIADNSRNFYRKATKSPLSLEKKNLLRYAKKIIKDFRAKKNFGIGICGGFVKILKYQAEKFNVEVFDIKGNAAKRNP